MVAYSFRRFFAPQISIGIKMQTIRACRSRHARPGETIQLYVGMRTAHCAKICPDVQCTEVLPVRIRLTSDAIQSICLDGEFLDQDRFEDFARLDGFAPEHINGLAIDMCGDTALANMSRFWVENHGAGIFEGVLIRWEPMS